MSLQWGRVTPDQWEKVKAGGGQDRVTPGDYFAQPSEIRHIDPSKNDKGLGTYIVAFTLTEDNADDVKGKVVEFRCMYHPGPDTPDNLAKMNEISLQGLGSLVVACNMEPLTDPDGHINIVRTVEGLVASQPKILGTIEHRTHEGSLYQDFGTFRPVA